MWAVLQKLEEFYAIGGGSITLGDPHGENFDEVCTLIILTSCLYTPVKNFSTVLALVSLLSSAIETIITGRNTGSYHIAIGLSLYRTMCLGNCSRTHNAKVYQPRQTFRLLSCCSWGQSLPTMKRFFSCFNVTKGKDFLPTCGKVESH